MVQRRSVSLFVLLFFLAIVSNAQLVINEYSVHKGLNDFGQSHDWIEIYNNSVNTIDLSDYYLSDEIDNPQKWNLPNIDLASDELIAICASGLNISEKIDHWESLVLAENLWRYQIGNAEPDTDWKNLDFNDDSWSVGTGGIGYGDNDDNTIIGNVNSIYMRREFQIADLNDLGSMILHADFDDAFVAYLNGIEIARSDNILGDSPPYNASVQFDMEALLYQGLEPFSKSFDEDEVETLLQEGVNVFAVQVHNVSLSSSDLSSNFYLSTAIKSNEYNYFELPSWFTPEIENNYFHSNFKLSLDENIILAHEDGNIVDLVLVDESLEFQISKGRKPNGSNNWCFFNTPSPESSNVNSICYEGFAETPELSSESGWYVNDFTIFAEDNNGTIHYTTNGDIPTTSSLIYSEPILIDSTSIYSFRAFADGNILPSKIVDRIYILDKDNHNLPVLSIYTNEENLWDFNTGIYVSGPNAEFNYPFFGSNFWQPWSRFSRLEFFDENKNKIAEEHLDIEIHGGWSRAEPQKSFRFDFKSEYTGNLEYSIFDSKPELNSFNNFNVRNGGQHVNVDKIQDAIITRASRNLSLDVQAYQPCILYLNGAYWGVYGIREKMDEHYIQSNHDLSDQNLDLLNSFGVLNGSDDQFLLDVGTILNEDVTGPFFYSNFSNLFDIQNYIDYFSVQTYIQNMDWLGINWGANNIKLWREQSANSKWRYMLFDTDAAFGFFGQNIFNNYIEAARNPSFPNAHSLVFNHVLENNQFKCEFANRSADLINTTFEPNNLFETTEVIKSDIENAMQDHIDYWNAPGSIDAWNESINSILNYNFQRINTARNHLQQSLDLNGQFSINLDVFPAGSGSITINSITPLNYPWQGVYFNGCPVEIIAEANEGFEFSHWSENGHLSQADFDQNLIVDFFQNDNFVANFLPALSVEEVAKNGINLFPNPSSGLLKLNVSEGHWHSYRVFSSEASLVMESKIKWGENTIDLTHLSDGVYILEIHGEYGVSFERVVLKK